MASRFLTTNFENTQTSIETNPQNEDNLINDYINMIIENKNNSRFVRSATYRDSGGVNNMPNIKIMNNFQRYGPDGYEQPIFIPTTTAAIVSTSNLGLRPLTTSLVTAGINSNLVPPASGTSLASAAPASLPGAGSNLVPPASLPGAGTSLASAPPASLPGSGSGAAPASLPGAGAGSNLVPPASLPGTSLASAAPASLPGSVPGSNLAPPQSFTNRETFQNYYNNYINGGFKEYYHI